MTQFAISVPQAVTGGAFDPSGFGAHMARAETLGFESAWGMEHVIGGWPNIDVIEALTYAAACTERIRLGCSVFVTPLHNPVHLAKSLGSLDQVSMGRLEVGVSTGGRARPFSAFEVDPTTIVGRFTEGLRLMKALWTEPYVSFNGRFWQLEDARMEPKPIQKPHPPIWIGGSHPAALRRAVRYGDGFFGAGSVTTDQFAQQVPIVRQALAEAGRDPSTFRFAKRVYVLVDDDVERARRKVSEGLQRIYSSFGLRLQAVAVFGPPDACAEGVRKAIEVGAGLVLFAPLSDQTEQMERLAAEVIPHLS